jgi:hypothetical protein
MSRDLEIIDFTAVTNLPPPRPRRGAEPIEYDCAPVSIRGDALDQVLWRGRQWAVTTFGIECLDGTYTIAKDRLFENVDAYGWPLHITQKNWADSDDFCTAWLVALALHGPQAKRVRGAIARSYPSELRPGHGRGGVR